MKKIRTLKANEIEVRTAMVKDGKATQLLYIDSRAATDLLDETYGMENWTIEYKDVAGQIYGRLSVYDTETNRWVFREDTGSPANIEKEKSLASDIVKRCIVRFGVTELYSTPKIVIPDDGYGNSGYKVSEIDYNEYREITHLVIVNRFNKEVFRWDKGDVTPTYKTAPKQVINDHIDHNELEWSPEDNRQPVAVVQMTKQLTPAEELTQWYQSITNADPQTQRFYKYYLNKINTGQWKGTMNIEKLYGQWMNK